MTLAPSPEALQTLPGRKPLPATGLTFEEFLEWADEDTWAEWVDGEVIFLTATDWHQRTVGFLQALAQHWIEAQGIEGVVLTAPFLMRCQPGMPGREPDVLYIAPETRSRMRGVYLDGPADVVVEVVSPESRRRDRNDKYFEYERGGVREYWIIDPETPGLAEFYRRDETAGVFRRIAPDESGIYHSEALHGLPLAVDWLYQRPLPPLLGVLREWGLVPGADAAPGP